MTMLSVCVCVVVVSKMLYYVASYNFLGIPDNKLQSSAVIVSWFEKIKPHGGCQQVENEIKLTGINNLTCSILTMAASVFAWNSRK